jgi:hypothetical protein
MLIIYYLSCSNYIQTIYEDKGDLYDKDHNNINEKWIQL